MSEKKATKKRPSKSKKGRSLNKIYAGVTLLAVLLMMTLTVALNSVNKNTPQVHTTPQIVQNTHENKVAPVIKSTPAVKKEYERRKYPLKFDEDENLSQIFANSKKKDEFSAPKEKKQEHKNAEKELAKSVTEQRSEQNDTKNLLANLPSAIAQNSVKKDKNETTVFEANVSTKT
ncbi:MAG: divergent polysaccharide deacetylase family protein, partial [Campylobacter curvus]